jgi:NADH dehydrogenase (ubiquinone) 1 alpha subcomplex subunit 9
MGTSMVLPYRGEVSDLRHLKPLGDLGQIAFLPCDVYQLDDVREAVAQSNLVINLIGKNYSTANFSCEQTNVVAAANIAKACAEVGVQRLIHVSALGVSSDSQSDWARSKALGEEQVRRHFPNATILRPATLFGIGDHFISKLANLVRFHYLMPNLAPGRRIQPLWVSDLGNALLATLRDTDTIGRTYELAGPEIFTHRDVLELISEHTAVPLSHAVQLPDFVVRLATRLYYRNCRPPIFSLEELDWYRDGDVLPGKNALSIQDLGVQPASLHDHIVGLTMLYRLPKTRYLV